jgi:vacuolar-type H+-ATPase subunit H
LASEVESTVKALMEFESNLDSAKSAALEVKRSMVREAQALAETAKSNAISEAQRRAAETLAAARKGAEKDADSIRKSGEASLKRFEAAVSRRKAKAVDVVVARLLGEGS